MSVPIIDIFAGPGGLGEGFASVQAYDGKPFFHIGLSIEKDAVAHKTLTLRKVFRKLRSMRAVEQYYHYIRGEITDSEFRDIPEVREAFSEVTKEAQCIELGKSDTAVIDQDIKSALAGQDVWVLIGGPPCQAYSLAGRARRANDKEFYNDEKHFLYKEYLRIIKEHKPAIFVMENVKGLLSSKHSGNSMFNKIIDDLTHPSENLEYEIRSFVKHGSGLELEPNDYVIHSEKYGIPQKRHRVVLLGVRKDVALSNHSLICQVEKMTTVYDAIGDLPAIRSKLSKNDSFEGWLEAKYQTNLKLDELDYSMQESLLKAMKLEGENSINLTPKNSGGKYIVSNCSDQEKVNFGEQNELSELSEWLQDSKIGGVCQHEARSHMPSDISRYYFSSTFAEVFKYSPTLDIFPIDLLPDHINIYAENIPFKDRFKVQCFDQPSSTVVAHIAKDGHYYIHYDPIQCRSLTVREAARLQTFPDNYFFEGNRTQQYTQIGNAVPPLLAHKLAHVVKQLLNKMNRKIRQQELKPIADFRVKNNDSNSSTMVFVD